MGSIAEALIGQEFRFCLLPFPFCLFPSAFHYSHRSKLMKTPDRCQNMADIRAAIDQLDRQVIELLGQRFAYVKAASQYKTSEASVKAPERLQAMLQQRREWADAVGLSPDAIEKLYRDLVNHFIAEEMKAWKAKDS